MKCRGAHEIFRLCKLKQKMLVEYAAREGKRERIEDMTVSLYKQSHT